MLIIQISRFMSFIMNSNMIETFRFSFVYSQLGKENLSNCLFKVYASPNRLNEIIFSFKISHNTKPATYNFPLDTQLPIPV